MKKEKVRVKKEEAQLHHQILQVEEMMEEHQFHTQEKVLLILLGMQEYLVHLEIDITQF